MRILYFIHFYIKVVLVVWAADWRALVATVIVMDALGAAMAVVRMH